MGVSPECLSHCCHAIHSSPHDPRTRRATTPARLRSPDRLRLHTRRYHALLGEAVNFRDVPITVDADVPADRICVVTDRSRHFFYLNDTLTPEQRTAQSIADRLLDRLPTGTLTLDIMQRALDAAAPTYPATIIMSPTLRRQYLALIEPDARYISTYTSGT